MKLFFYFFCVSLLATQAYGQMLVNTWDRFNYPGQGITAASLQNGFVYGINPSAGEVTGISYYDTAWAVGSFIMFKDTTLYKGIPARYDIQRNVVEIKFKVGMRVLESVQVNSFALQKNELARVVFVNVQNFSTEDKLKGFFEMLSSGKLNLMANAKVWVKQPTYNPALDVGSKDTELIREEKLYTARDGKAQRFSASKKNILELMADKKPEMEAYLKQNQPDLKNKTQLARVFDYYNGLQ